MGFPELPSYSGPKIFPADGECGCKPVKLKEPLPHGHTDIRFAALSHIFSKLGDELQQDEDAPLHTVLSEYQTFLVAVIRDETLPLSDPRE